MPRRLLRCWSLLVLAVLSLPAGAKEPSRAEQLQVSAAQRQEASARWEDAAKSWEFALSLADRAGEVDRAMEYGASALTTWRKVSGPPARDREAFVIGVLAKLDIATGRLV